MQDCFLKSEHLGFRCWTDADLPLAMALWGSVEVTALIGGPFTMKQIQTRLAEEIEQQRAAGVQYWPMFLLNQGQFVGCAGLRPYRAEERIYELGVHLRPPYWGLGLAMEASQAVITLAFDTVGAAALFAGHHPQNEASRRLLLKLGFAFTHEELYPPTGLMHPSYLLKRNE